MRKVAHAPSDPLRTRRSWFALTGTPGCGKSSVAARLGPGAHAVEVADLALKMGTGRRIRGGVEVDLNRTAASLRRQRGAVGVLVGHVAHLLPIRNVIVLRCHPLQLDLRLRASERFGRRAREENVGTEALDLILVEARTRRRRIWEVDTTDRSIDWVARRVSRILTGGSPPGAAGVDWLADPAVTEHLLHPPR
ncbi:MAG: AAA family ATPase [Thermoplasmata archaeon]